MTTHSLTGYKADPNVELIHIIVNGHNNIITILARMFRLLTLVKTLFGLTERMGDW